MHMNIYTHTIYIIIQNVEKPPSQAKCVQELGDIFSMVTDVMETAAIMTDPQQGCDHVILSLERLWEELQVPAPSGPPAEGIYNIYIYIYNDQSGA